METSNASIGKRKDTVPPTKGSNLICVCAQVSKVFVEIMGSEGRVLGYRSYLSIE